MSDSLAALAHEAFRVLATVGAPLFGVILVVGLTIGVLQSATQVNDSAVGFVPKLCAALVAVTGEISGDMTRWELPGARMKNGKPHVVHLSAAARAVLRSIPRVEGCDLVFTTTAYRVAALDAAPTSDSLNDLSGGPYSLRHCSSWEVCAGR